MTCPVFTILSSRLTAFRIPHFCDGGGWCDPNYTDEETELKSFTVRMRGMMGNTWELPGTHRSLLNQILPEQEPPQCAKRRAGSFPEL